MTLTAQEVAHKIGTKHISKSKGIFRYWQSYYWGFTRNADKLTARVKEVFPNAEIVDSGNHFHAFVGGAKSGTAKDSYLWVKFKINS